jgi:glucose/arabinose dehydrogenase
MKKILFLIIGALLVGVGYSSWVQYKGIWYATAPADRNIAQIIKEVVQNGNETLPPGENKTKFPLNVPDGYSVSVYAEGLNKPRDLVFDPKGTPLVSAMGEGRVYALFGGAQDVVAGGLDRPHGLVFAGGKLFVAEVKAVYVYDYDIELKKAINKKKILDLPSGSRHFTRSLLVKDGRLYISIGSSCDACVESDPRYAAVWSANLDGSDFKPYATGLRNSVFITLHPVTNEIWGTEMGRDFLGDDLPPEEVNIIREGAHYGWPYCYGDKVVDTKINPGGSRFDCSTTVTPHIVFQAHSAPLGLDFLGNDLLMSYHGSWNRSVPTGYKVVRVRLDPKGTPLSGPEDFLTGWMQGSTALGRPVDILVRGKGEEVFISDDKAGVVYLLKSF